MKTLPFCQGTHAASRTTRNLPPASLWLALTDGPPRSLHQQQGVRATRIARRATRCVAAKRRSRKLPSRTADPLPPRECKTSLWTTRCCSLCLPFPAFSLNTPCIRVLDPALRAVRARGRVGGLRGLSAETLAHVASMLLQSLLQRSQRTRRMPPDVTRSFDLGRTSARPWCASGGGGASQMFSRAHMTYITLFILLLHPPSHNHSYHPGALSIYPPSHDHSCHPGVLSLHAPSRNHSPVLSCPRSGACVSHAQGQMHLPFASPPPRIHTSLPQPLFLMCGVGYTLDTKP